MVSRQEAEQRTLDAVLNTVNSISLIGAVLVMTTVAITSHFRSSAAKRLSFRLSMWIALADFVFCSLSYFNIAVDQVAECNVITGLGYIANLTYIFLTACMAFNLQMVFVQQQHNPRWSEGFYVVASFGAACAIVIPFTAVAMAMDKCTLFRAVDLPYNLVVFWMMLGVWEVVGILYCSITIIKVVLKLTRFNHNITGISQTSPDRSQRASQRVSHRVSNNIQSRVAQVVRRLVFYPLIPVITQTPYVIAANLSLIHSGDKSLLERYIYYVPSYSAGLLNAIVFLFDPALPEIYKDFQAYVYREYSLPLDPQATWFTKFIAPFLLNFVKDEDENINKLSRHSKSSLSFFHSGMARAPHMLGSEKSDQISPLSSASPLPSSLHTESNSPCSVVKPAAVPPSYIASPARFSAITFYSPVLAHNNTPYINHQAQKSHVSICDNESTKDLTEKQLTLLL